MNIKLNDCVIIDIFSDMKIDKARYYYETDDIIQNITFVFDDNSNVTFKFYNDSVCFGKVVGFFFGKDFTKITKYNFIKMFTEECECE